MKQAAFLNFDMPWLPISGLFIFLICFSLYTFWTFKKSNKAIYDQAALLPLEDDMRGQHEKRN